MAYLTYQRASTKSQDAERSNQQFIDHAEQYNITYDKKYIENASGASLERPELNALLDYARDGDYLIIEHIDRLSRLPRNQWLKLKGRIQSIGIKLVVINLPTSHRHYSDEDNTIVEIINDLLMDLAAEQANADYKLRRTRQAEGIANAKQKGVKFGRPYNYDKRAKIKGYLLDGYKYSYIEKELKCSKKTIAEVKKELQSENC